METGYRMIYMINNGIANILSDKLGFNLNMVLGINSPANKIKIVDITDWIKTINASFATTLAINGSNTIAYQHGRDKQIWITIENTQYLTG